MNEFSSRERARRFHANYHSGQRKRSVKTHGHELKRFQTPKSVSDDEEQHSSTNTAGSLLKKHKKPHKKSLKEQFKAIPKKHWIIIGAITAVLLAGGGVTIWALTGNREITESKITVNEAPPEPTTVASNLTGLQVEPAVNERPVTAVMIENSLAARPQSGLLQAGVMFEAIAEGGITRYSALYQDKEPDYIGPVRSARKPWLQWNEGFDAALAHAGGSAEALQLIRDWNVKDLDQFANPGAYWRVSNRASPHNLYTSIERLRNVERQKGYGAAQYTSLERKEEENLVQGQSKARVIDFNVSSANYNVHYAWDRSSNTYKRSIGGARHTDERSGNQLAPKVVVALVMTQGKNGIYYTYDTIGDGPVFIFQDGKVFRGRWHKSSNTDQFTFTNQNGGKIRLNPGQTWFTVLGGTDRVSFGP